MLHDFQTSLRQVQPHEARMRKYLQDQGKDVARVSLVQERLGIDATSEDTTFEFKCDSRAEDTGNAYLETVSVDKPFKPGWVYTCTADWILYYVLSQTKPYVLWLRPDDLRAQTAMWQRIYPTIVVKNRTYRGSGILVPLTELRKYASLVEILEAA